MKNLKKALGKDDLKKYETKNQTISYKKPSNNISGFKKNKQWKDIDDLI